MKFRIIKKEENKKGGFALLFSVLVSSLLLTIGLSIFSIALKELAISTASRQSIYAFYAADSGLEYARYHDLRAGDLGFVFDASLPITISEPQTRNGDVTDSEGPNYEVTITKERTLASSTAKINTAIFSKGWDTRSGDRVERAVELKY